MFFQLYLIYKIFSTPKAAPDTYQKELFPSSKLLRRSCKLAIQLFQEPSKKGRTFSCKGLGHFFKNKNGVVLSLQKSNPYQSSFAFAVFFLQVKTFFLKKIRKMWVIL